LQLHFASPLGDASLRSVYSFLAYVVRSDGAWQEVTNQATWSSPDPIVFRSLGSGRFAADSVGLSGVRVQYQGLGAFADIVVIDPARQAVPRLSLSPAQTLTVGTSGQATAFLLSSSGGSRDVTPDAAWDSSDPAVASVDRGRITVKAPGTTRIMVAYDGLVSSYTFSVRPPAR
jgi:hypothetical protein